MHYPTEADTRRELEINRLFMLMNRTRSKPIKRILFRRIQKPHEQRSPEVVQQMEIERGLWRG